MPPGSSGPRRAGRSPLALIVIGVVIATMVAGFLALGVWQLERRAWKLDLIRQVDARIHAEPAPAPGPDQWPAITRDHDQYRRVTVTGVFDHDRETLTQAVTDLGPGFWVLTPLRTDEGVTVLINRGFVPADRRAPSGRPGGRLEGRQTVTGLLRLTEPHGGFLRANDPAVDRWRSRDVQAIAEHRGLTDAAHYFIDADATPNPGGLPVGGLTVVRFPNSHLIYALTWFGLALLTASGGVYLIRDSRRSRPSRDQG